MVAKSGGDKRQPTVRYVIGESGKVRRIDLRSKDGNQAKVKSPARKPETPEDRAKRKADAVQREADAIDAVKSPRKAEAKKVGRRIHRPRGKPSLESATPERSARIDSQDRWIGEDGVQRFRDQPLDRLKTRNTITERMFQAGDTFRTDWLYGGMLPLSASDPSKPPGGGGSGAAPGFTPASESQAAARMRYRKAYEAMAANRMMPVLDAIILEPMRSDGGDEGVFDIGHIGQRMFGRKQKDKARAAAIELFKIALDLLADHYRIPGQGY